MIWINAAIEVRVAAKPDSQLKPFQGKAAEMCAQMAKFQDDAAVKAAGEKCQKAFASA